MAHFAEIDQKNTVLRVIVVENAELIDPVSGREDEILGKAFCKKLFGGDWVQTSINGKIRKRFAAVGYTYNESLDSFIPPKPFDSWILNEDTLEWDPPSEKPTISLEESEKGSYCIWNEENLSWDIISK